MLSSASDKPLPKVANDSMFEIVCLVQRHTRRVPECIYFHCALVTRDDYVIFWISFTTLPRSPKLIRRRYNASGRGETRNLVLVVKLTTGEISNLTSACANSVGLRHNHPCIVVGRSVRTTTLFTICVRLRLKWIR